MVSKAYGYLSAFLYQRSNASFHYKQKYEYISTLGLLSWQITEADFDNQEKI